MISLKDVLENVGESDPNTATIMESFNLSFDDLLGFDEGHEHVIIKDNDNRIYANIDPTTKRRVDDFFSSF